MHKNAKSPKSQNYLKSSGCSKPISEMCSFQMILDHLCVLLLRESSTAAAVEAMYKQAFKEISCGQRFTESQERGRASAYVGPGASSKNA